MTAELDYASTTPWYRRRVLRWSLFWALLVVGLGFAAYQYGPWIYERGRILYLQRRCMNYVNRGYVPPAKLPYTTPTPAELTDYLATFPPGSAEATLMHRIYLRPGEGVIYCMNTNRLFEKPPQFRAMVTLERNGIKRLCILREELHSSLNLPGDTRCILGNWEKFVIATLMEPADWHNNGRIVSTDGHYFTKFPQEGYYYAETERAYVDPADASSFLIPIDPLPANPSYKTISEKHVARFRLSAAGDKLELTFEKAP